MASGQTEGLADALQLLMNDPRTYEEMAHNARGRIFSFFQLEDAMGAYNRLYREMGELAISETRGIESVVNPSREAEADLNVRSRVGAHRMPPRHARGLR